MLDWLKKRVHEDMLRPFLYTAFTRGIMVLFFAQLIHFFAPDWPLADFSNLSFLLAALFALGAVLAWLRMDGLGIPHLKLPRMKRKDPAFLQSDIADHIDDDIIRFDDLCKEDQDTCVFLCDLALALLCLILAFLV